MAAACRPAVQETPPEAAQLVWPRIDADKFRGEIDGQPAGLYWLGNASGMQVAITNYGGRIVSLLVPDRQDNTRDVVLGFDKAETYALPGNAYYGSVVGRYANRIARGQFTLDDQTYTLATNNAPNHLHGGPRGFHSVMWEVRSVDTHSIELAYTSPDGEEGYPGTLTVVMRYTLATDKNELYIDYEAQTDKPTIVNLSNHSFFNLEGEGSGPIADHLLVIAADHYTPVDSTLIPTGELRPVAGTPFDFRAPVAIGARLDSPDEQLGHGGGYDHNFVVSETAPSTPQFLGRAIAPSSGIAMEIYATEPCVQFYGGNFMNGAQRGKTGRTFDYRTAFCLEPQHAPDSPNQPQFPSTVLRPGETYSSRTVFRFGVAQ
ncbi:MAG: galactose mutarotase [Bacteroidia bacterium]